jgi:hypothetical protein
VDKRRWLGRLSIGVHYTTKEDDKRLVGWNLCGAIWTGELSASFCAQKGQNNEQLNAFEIPSSNSAPNVFQNLTSTERPTLENRGWGTLRVVLNFSAVDIVLVNFFVNFTT